MKTVLNNLQVSSNGDFVYNADQELSKEEVEAAVNYNRNEFRSKYKENMDLYLAKNDKKEFERQLGPDYHLVADLPKYIVDTYNGYFTGIPPVMTLTDQNNNAKLQEWLAYSSFVDKLNEVSKQSDIYGRSYLFIYQNEQAQTNVTVMPPTNSLMVYDDTVDRSPLCYIRYSYDPLKGTESDPLCHVYYKDKVQTYTNGQLVDEKVNVYSQIPAICFYENNEKTGVFDTVKSLIKALDDALSQKANQVSYFDNAYLVIEGADFPKDPKSGETKVPDLRKNRLLMLNPIDPSAKANIQFLAKPDADNLQEHYIDRLTKLIYQIAMVPDPNDENFSGQQSGIALKYHYLPMQNKASSKERKFTQSLRDVFKVVFSTGMVLPATEKDAWKDMKFTFTRNVPEDLDSQIKAAKDADGLVSKQTQLSLLSFVSDPAQELKQVSKEQRQQIQNVRAASGVLTDAEKDADDDEQ